MNKADEALPLFKMAVEANPSIEQYWLSYIDALIKEKQYDNAQKVLTQAKKQGIDEAKLNSLEAKLAYVDRVQEFPHENPPQQQLDALLEHYQTGRFSDAEKLAIAITKEFPSHPLAWNCLLYTSPSPRDS